MGQPLQGFFDPVAGVLQKFLGEPLHTEFNSLGIKRLGDSIGIEEQQIPLANMERIIGAKPIEDAAAVNPDGHTLGIESLHLVVCGSVHQGGIMTRSRQQSIPAMPVHDDIGHADEHILFHVGIKLPVDGAQHGCRRKTPGCLTPEGATAHGHDEGGGNALPRDIRDHYAKMILINRQVIKIVTTESFGRKVQATDLESLQIWCPGGKKDLLNLTSNLEIVIQGELLSRRKMDGLVEKGEG